MDLKVFKENKAFLDQFETNFRTATKSDFTRAVTEKEFEALKELYTKITGIKLDLRPNCGMCQLKLIKAVGLLYYNANEQANKTATNTQEPQGGKEQKTNKKRTKQPSKQ